MERDVRIFHIGYNESTASNVEDGFELLDNTANTRPDWYEIWPIVEHLKGVKLNEDALYGFFSPKFRAKTGLGPRDVQKFVNANSTAEVFIFSPQPDIHMAFRSVFHGGERFNPGYLSAAQKILLQSGVHIDLQRVVMDSRVSVYSNYFVAPLRFWRQWLSWIEVLIDFAESDKDPSLRHDLCCPTTYAGGVQRKVFIAEGFASLLCWGGDYRVAAFDSFAVPWFSVFSSFKKELIALDALKMAYRDTGRIQYIQQFDIQSGELMDRALVKQQP